MATLFVSDLAALTGRHAYQDAREAKLKVWKRLSPSSYFAAEQRTRVTVHTDEKIVASLGSEIRKEVAIAVGAVEEADATQKVVEIVGKPLVLATTGKRETVRKILAHPKQSVREKLLLRTFKSFDLKGASKAKCLEHASTLAALGPQAEDEDIKAFVEHPRIADCAQVVKSLTAAVNKMRGTVNEGKAIAAYEQKTGKKVIKRNSEFYRRNIGTPEDSCYIGGRVDGLTDNKVIETKCRRNRFFSSIPEYEKAQMQCYMFLTRLPQCDWVQKYGGDVRSKTIDFDADYWNALRRDVREFWTEFQEMLHSRELQDQLLNGH